MRGAAGDRRCEVSETNEHGRHNGPDTAERQPHDVSGGDREHRTKRGATGDRSEDGGASESILFTGSHLR